MKVFPFKIPKPENDALYYEVDHDAFFYDKLHQHEEIQVSLIMEGEGTLIVGDSVNSYGKNDVLVIGSNVPHVFKSDLKATKLSHMLTLFFTKDSFGNHFFELEELRELDVFFKRAKHGFKPTSNKNLMKALFLQLEEATKLNRFIILLQLLKLISESNFTSLSSFLYTKEYTANEGNRMRNVFEYTMNNFQNDISLNVISEVANMTKNAFCKYFKKRTNKTYVQFLNELRVEHACRLLLQEKDISIAQVADYVGFNNMSNFNRQFKKVKKVSPKKFRLQNIHF